MHAKNVASLKPVKRSISRQKYFLFCLSIGFFGDDNKGDRYLFMKNKKIATDAIYGCYRISLLFFSI